jgi:hypothetical protein
MDEQEPRAGNYCYGIGLMKPKSEWRICHGVYAVRHEGGPDEWKPITDCSVEKRVHAAPTSASSERRSSSPPRSTWPKGGQGRGLDDAGTRTLLKPSIADEDTAAREVPWRLIFGCPGR